MLFEDAFPLAADFPRHRAQEPLKAPLPPREAQQPPTQGLISPEHSCGGLRAPQGTQRLKQGCSPAAQVPGGHDPAGRGLAEVLGRCSSQHMELDSAPVPPSTPGFWHGARQAEDGEGRSKGTKGGRDSSFPQPARPCPGSSGGVHMATEVAHLPWLVTKSRAPGLHCAPGPGLTGITGGG